MFRAAFRVRGMAKPRKLGCWAALGLFAAAGWAAAQDAGMLPAPRARLDPPVVAPSVGEPMGGKGSPPSGESCSPKGGVPGQDHKQASADPPHDEETAWSPEDWLKVPAI